MRRSRKLTPLLCLLLGCLGVHADAGALRLGKKGVEIDGGSMGTFSLPYPKVEAKAAAGRYEAAIEQRVEGGQALLKYAGGVALAVQIEAGGKIAYRFSGNREAIKGFRVGELLVPFNYADGGTWRIGDGDAKPFPREKPAKPFLYQGNATSFELASVDGKRIRIELPPWSYQQLQDNREWNWKVFAWWFQSPFNKDKPAHVVTVTIDAGGGKAVVLADRFGQTTRRDFPGKVTSLAELKADAKSERAYYASFTPPAGDAFGGLPGSGKRLGLRRTGFFHVEPKGKRWVLVDPEGNAFFHLGICGFGCCDDYTYIEGRRKVYEWLPPRESEFAAAYHPDTWWNPRAFSFYRSNVIRKYGRLDDAELVARMVDRVRRVGFNSAGAFSGSSTMFRKERFPFVASLPLGRWTLGPGIPGVRGLFDPFDGKVVAKMNELFAKSLPPLADEPLLIGYFLENEQAFEDLPRAIPRLDAKHACKRRLVALLREKYADIAAFNAAWGTAAASFDALADQGLPVTTKAAFADMQAFTELFLDTYYRTVTETFRKHDRNHMLLGNRWQPGTANNQTLCRVAGRYMDVISINYYTDGIDAGFVRRLYEWTGRKPQMWSEFFYTAEKESNVAGRSDLATQRERGLAYRQYAEGAAALGFVVGIEWFTLIDQAVTGRFFEKYNGERQNTGLFNVCDRPYKDLLAEMARTHRVIYGVWLSGKRPYVLDNPRFSAAGGKTRRTVRAGRATGPMAIDGRLDGWPGRPPERIGADRVVVGREAGGVEAAFKVCWDATNLYLLANVADPTPMRNERRGADLWSADGLELFIGSEALGQGGALRFTDRQILLGAGKSAQTHVVNSPAQPAIKVAVVPSVDGKGYTMEAAIPWTALAISPKDGLELLFDVAVDDSTDGRGRRCQLMWNGGARNSSDRGAWGRLRLER